MYATVPFAYIAFALIERRRWKEDRSELTDQLVLLALAGFFMFLAIAPSPSLMRLSTVSPPALVLLAWLLNRPGKDRRRLEDKPGGGGSGARCRDSYPRSNPLASYP